MSENIRNTGIQDMIEYTVTNGGTFHPVGFGGVDEYPYILLSMRARQEKSRLNWIIDRAFPHLRKQRDTIQQLAGLAPNYRLSERFKLDLSALIPKA